MKKWGDLQTGQKIGWGIVIGFAALVSLVAVFAPEPEQSPANAAATAESLAEWRREVQAHRIVCDLSAAVLAQQLGDVSAGGGDAVSGYQAATNMRDRCGSSFIALDDVAVPYGIASETQSRISAAIDTCETELWLKKEAGEKAAQFFDGDRRPSVVVGLQQDVNEAKAQADQCDRALDSVTPLEPAAAQPGGG